MCASMPRRRNDEAAPDAVGKESHVHRFPVTPRRSALASALGVLAIVVVMLVPGTAAASDLHATSSNLASVFNSAQGGDTIYLASGNYGQFNGGSKSSTVTLRPESGATPTMSVWFNPANNIR